MYQGLEILGNLYNFPNRTLEENIKHFFEENNEKNYKSVIKEMENSNFLVPLLSKETEVDGLVLINNFIPVFSNMEEFKKINIKQELNFLFYNINEICEVIKNGEFQVSGFIIDPCGINMTFDKKIILNRN